MAALSPASAVQDHRYPFHPTSSPETDSDHILGRHSPLTSLQSPAHKLLQLPISKKSSGLDTPVCGPKRRFESGSHDQKCKAQELYVPYLPTYPNQPQSFSFSPFSPYSRFLSRGLDSEKTVDAGQAALPGGKADTLAETPFTTARREAFEEIGLPLEDKELPPGYTVEHLTELPANLAMTELGVRPCVAYLNTSGRTTTTTTAAGGGDGKSDGRGHQSGGGGGGYGGAAGDRVPDPARDLLPKLDAKEVAAVFTAPFHNFLRQNDEDPDVRQKVPGEWYKGSWHSWHETPWRMHQFHVPVAKGTVFKAHHDDEASSASDGDDNPVAGPAAPPTEAEKDREQKEVKAKEDVNPARKPRSGLVPPLPASTYRAPPDALAQPRYRVFGMTARIMVDCARVAYGEDPDFEHNSDFGDEEMIERLMRIGRLSPVKKEGERLT